MLWESWRGHTYRQTHAKLQRTLNAWGVFIEAVTRGWIVCPALKMWPTFLWMCYSSELWVAHHHVKTHKHIIICFYLIHPSNRLMTNRRGPTTHTNTLILHVCVRQREGAGNLLWPWQKKLSAQTRPSQNSPNIKKRSEKVLWKRRLVWIMCFVPWLGIYVVCEGRNSLENQRLKKTKKTKTLCTLCDCESWSQNTSRPEALFSVLLPLPGIDEQWNYTC